MIYYMEHRQSKPKRIRDDYALDFYQMWFGNDSGQELYDQGARRSMPGEPGFVMWGEEISENGWFKQILQGKAEDGYVEFDGTYGTTAGSWN